MKKIKICVLGAGIVGLASAYELSQQGYDVTVLDSAQAVGAGASGNNGAQLSYSYVQPLADPSIWLQLPKLLLSPDSPLKLRPQWDVQQWRWAMAFMQACNAATSARSTAQLLALAARSRTAFDSMMAWHAIDCDYSAAGKLVLYPNTDSFDAAKRQMALQNKLGSMQTAVSALGSCELEPALANYLPHFAGAIYTPSESAVDCLKLCQGLEHVLRCRGVKFMLSSAVLKLVTRNSKCGATVTAAHTSVGPIEADYFVLALGSYSLPLARSVGVHLPVYPIKGYSVTLDVASGDNAPHISVTDIARKVVFARLGQRLRIAGMAELVGYNRDISNSSIASLQRSTQAVFPQLAYCTVKHPWAGLRPATPTGLPIIGVQAGGPDNLIINTGHGALGLTLAFGTAKQVVDVLQSLQCNSAALITATATAIA